MINLTIFTELNPIRQLSARYQEKHYMAFENHIKIWHT